MTVATLHDWLLFGHIVAAMVWLGGITVLGAFAVRILREDDPVAVRGFLGALRRIGPLVLAPAPVLLLGFGIWAVLDSDAWDFGQLWIDLALGLFVVAFLIGAAHQSRAALAAERAEEARGGGGYAELAPLDAVLNGHHQYLGDHAEAEAEHGQADAGGRL